MYSAFWFTACTPSSKNNNHSYQADTLKYAKQLSFHHYGQSKIATIRNADGNDVYRYALQQDTIVIPDSLYDQKIVTPVFKTVCLASSHLAIMEKLNVLDKVIAYSDKKYTHNKKVIDRINNGHIQEVGNYNSINMEKLVAIHPDVIFESVTGTAYDNYAKFKELGLKVAGITAYQEPHPLGRIEWIKLFGAFTGKSKKANEIFNAIVKKYKASKKQLASIEDKPSVIAGYKRKDTWVAPGGNGYFAQFIKDAGGNYVWSSDSTTGNINISFENALEKGMEADIWINIRMEAGNFDQLLAQNPRLKEFKAVDNGNVFSNNAQVNKHGRNNYWEEGVTEPHIILQDLMKIFHPEKKNEWEMVYFKKATD